MPKERFESRPDSSKVHVVASSGDEFTLSIPESARIDNSESAPRERIEDNGASPPAGLRMVSRVSHNAGALPLWRIGFLSSEN